MLAVGDTSDSYAIKLCIAVRCHPLGRVSIHGAPVWLTRGQLGIESEGTEPYNSGGIYVV